jgi:hypothetical protein
MNTQTAEDKLAGVQAARLILQRLNQDDDPQLARLPPVHREVLKALVLAKMHPDIEARVICTNIEDLAEATTCVLLVGKGIEGSSWRMEDLMLELPNGSAVVVVPRLHFPT